MRRYLLSQILGTAALGGLLGWCAVGLAQDEPPPRDEGMEVLARGPVHEAFAEPTTARPEPSPIVPRQPPPAIDEWPPDEKPDGDNVQWIPGYWQWDETRDDYVWVSGFWRDVPPGRKWVPGHWQQVQEGWQWVAGFWVDAEVTELQYLPPPPSSVDAGPSTPAPNDNSIYVPGCWVYREARYFWRPGFWIAFRPGWVWVPAHYLWTPVGYVFIEGYWDRPLRHRGLLFAPVYLTREVLVRRDFQFVPRYVVRDDFLLGALFVRAETRHYYFGDYFEPRYRREGFVPWVDYRVNRVAYDPLFAYVRHEDRRLERDLRDLYTARIEGRAPAPPHTLVQQQKVIQNVTVNKNVTNVQNVVNNLTVLTPLTQVNRKAVKLERINREERTQVKELATRVREASRHRGVSEADLLSHGRPPARTTDKPLAVKLAVPQTPSPPKGRPAANVPPPPPLPRHQEREVPRAEGPPPARRIQTRTEQPPPPPQRTETPPREERRTEPPPPRRENPPPVPPRRDTAPPPPPPPRDERRAEPPPPRRENPPPPPRRDNVPPPPERKDNPPPPKKDNPPPPPKEERRTEPPPRHENVPPPPTRRDNPPPPPPQRKDNPPPPPTRTEPPPKRETPTPPPPHKENPPPPPPKREGPPSPPPSTQPPRHEAPPPAPPPGPPKKDSPPPKEKEKEKPPKDKEKKG